MIYELRLYHANMGRIDDIAARMEKLMPPVFKKHGFNVPLGQWLAVAGPTQPLYVWMLNWPSWEKRTQTYASIYGDEEWAKVRAETNGPSEMVLRFNIQLMNAAPANAAAKALFADPAGEVGGLHELVIQESYPGRLGDANKAMAEVDFPAIKECGGRVLGVFNNEAGIITPGLTWFVAWENYEARREGWKRYISMDAVKRQRQRERDELNTHLLGQSTCYLLEPTSYGTPNAAFAPKD
jgi:hypothetical protein